MTFEDDARVHISSRASAGTRDLYETDLDRWLRHCKETGADPDKPTLEAAVAFRDSLKLGDQTVRRILSALSSMYDACGIVNHFKSSKRLPRPAADDVALTQAYTKEEVAALFAAVPTLDDIGARDMAAMRILYDTGMRVSSVTSLRREQVYERADGQRVVVTKVKKRGRVEIELPRSSIEALDRWLERAPDSQFVFASERNDGPLTRRALNRRLAVYGERAKVKDAAPHRFRATYITEALDAGVPLNEIQAAVHHADPKTTQRYDRGVRGSGVADAVSKFRSGR